jgi:hypothetical protein
MSRRLASFGGLALLLASLACGGNAASPLTATCTPGTNQACACPAGGSGIQVCSAAGTYLACICGEGDAGAENPTKEDASVQHDAEVRREHRPEELR